MRPEAMTLAYPPTVIVRHSHENPRKCSVLPLRGREDILFLTYPVKERPCLAGYVRLAAEGPELTHDDAASGLLLLDGSWRWAGKMTAEFADVPARSLQGWRTAYPRISKQGTDPDNGLASVEALFIAYHVLGRPTQGLLDHYRWAEQFLRINAL
jgi:pre-rRNA-processing protein TSR3